jgi:predicted small lipoprotein YifL
MRRTIPILVILIGLLALWGCSKKNPTQATNTPQEQAFASESQTNAVRATGFVGSFSGGLGSTPGQPMPNGAPVFFPPSQTFNPPDSSWHKGQNPHQPPDTTWYWKRWVFPDSLWTFTDTVYVKFTPDIWGSGLPPVTRVDWQGLIYGVNSSSQTTTSLDESAWARYSTNPPDTTKTDGGFKVVGSVKTGSTTVSSYTYQFDWTNCTRRGWIGQPRTCSGTITWSATSSYAFRTYNLSGSYAFTNGSGTGEAKLSNVKFADFHFNNNGTGYYTLLSESWLIQHPFFW